MMERPTYKKKTKCLLTLTVGEVSRCTAVGRCVVQG